MMMTGRQKILITSLAVSVIVVFVALGYLIFDTYRQLATAPAGESLVARTPAPLPELTIATYTPPPSPTNTPVIVNLPSPTPTPTETVIPSPSPTPTAPPPPTSTPMPSATPTAPSPTPPPLLPPNPVPAAASGRVSEPSRLYIPAIGVDAPIIPVGLEPSGIMAAPAEAHQVGWYELGPRPGEPSNAVLAGHLDWYQKPGVFARLAELKPGDTIEVQSSLGNSYYYVVQEIETYEYETAPILDIFGPTTEPILTLITCAGVYDTARQAYEDRMVVRAYGTDQP